MKIVLDTNVLVSGMLNPFGSPGNIVRMVSAGTLELCLDARIMAEYVEVLNRPKFQLAADDIAALVDQIEACGHTVAPVPLAAELPDRDDEPFLEVTLASKAEYLVTGNLRHYPKSKRQDISVVAPDEFLKIFRKAYPEG